MFKQIYKKPFFACVFCVIYSAVSFAIALFGKWRTCAFEEQEDKKTEGKDNGDWKKKSHGLISITRCSLFSEAYIV